LSPANRREELQRQHAAISEPKPLLHPEMATIYRAKVTALVKALERPDSRSEATEALRDLVDVIVLTPVELRGNLAAMLGATRKTKRSPESDDLSLQVSLVAGARCQLAACPRPAALHVGPGRPLLTLCPLWLVFSALSATRLSPYFPIANRCLSDRI
jgi:hypothetical protein